MITEFDITVEMDALNKSASGFKKQYVHKKGTDGTWALFDVHDNIYRPVYLSTTSAGLFAYISLLKNIYIKGSIPGGEEK